MKRFDEGSDRGGELDAEDIILLNGAIHPEPLVTHLQQLPTVQAIAHSYLAGPAILQERLVIHFGTIDDAVVVPITGPGRRVKASGHNGLHLDIAIGQRRGDPGSPDS